MSDDAKQVLTTEQVRDRAPGGWTDINGMLRTRLTTDDFADSLELATKIAAAAEEANHHPDIDLRYGWVGLGLVSHDVGGITPRDIELAGTISRIAHDLGAGVTAATSTQMTVGIDTPDASAIRDFWSALTGHTPASDGSLPSPDGQLPQIWFQESELREGRDRMHLDVYVPQDLARERVDAVVAAGGRLVTDEFAPAWWVLADTDGNVACVCTAQEAPR